VLSLCLRQVRGSAIITLQPKLHVERKEFAISRLFVGSGKLFRPGECAGAPVSTPSNMDATGLESPASNLSEPPSDRMLAFALALLLVVATAALYAPAIRNGFVNFDDTDYVTRNAHVLRGFSWQNVVWAFGTRNEAANWHPLTWISHMVDVNLYGLHSAGHHFSNVLLQIIDVVLLFFFLRSATANTWRSAAIAALFAVHPLNVESVAWVAERKAVLCMFFLFLTLLAYVRYARKPSIARYIPVFVFFALGLMAKIMVIALPFALLLLDYWPLGRLPVVTPEGQADAPSFVRIFLKLSLEKIPLFLLSAGAAFMTLLVHRREGTLAAAMPFSWRLKNVLYSYLAYLGKAVWPTRLAVFYPHPENSLAWSTVALCTVPLIIITTLVWHYRQRRYLPVGWLWYLGTMVPMIGIIQSGRQGMADRYMYLPMIGLFVAVVWLLADEAEKLNLDRSFVAAAFLILMIPYCYVTRVQIGYWKDSYTLFDHALQVTKNNGMAENNFGVALMEQGDPTHAAPHFAAAVRLIPSLASAHYNLAVIFQREDRLQDAAREYAATISNSNDPAELTAAHNNLGILYLMVKNYPAATMELTAAIALNPTSLNSYIGRGVVEFQSSNFDAAIADFTTAIKLGGPPLAYFWLGRADEAKGDSPAAIAAYSNALRLAPGMNDARARLDALQPNSAETR
jgi:protein O-mannosyl-transferase